MKRIKHTEEQITRVLKRFDAGEKAADLAKEVGSTLPTFYNWKAKFGGMEVSDAKKLRARRQHRHRRRPRPVPRPLRFASRKRSALQQ
jgi:putative transposase